MDKETFIIFDDRSERMNALKNKLLKRLENLDDRKCLVLGMRAGTNGVFRFFKQISMKEYDSIRQLYCMYEFTDKLRIVSSEPQYGSMLNYLENGILSEDEYIEALLR